MNKSINLERFKVSLELLLNEVIESQRGTTVTDDGSVDMQIMITEMAADLAQMAALLSGVMAQRSALAADVEMWKLRFAIAKDFLTNDEQSALDSRISAVEDGRSNE